MRTLWNSGCWRVLIVLMYSCSPGMDGNKGLIAEHLVSEPVTCNDPVKNDLTEPAAFANRLTQLLTETLMKSPPDFANVGTTDCQHYREFVRARNEGRDVRKQFEEESVKMVTRPEFISKVLSVDPALSIQTRIYQNWFGTTPFTSSNPVFQQTDQDIRARIENAKSAGTGAGDAMAAVIRTLLTWPDLCREHGADFPSGCVTTYTGELPPPPTPPQSTPAPGIDKASVLAMKFVKMQELGRGTPAGGFQAAGSSFYLGVRDVSEDNYGVVYRLDSPTGSFAEDVRFEGEGAASITALNGVPFVGTEKPGKIWKRISAGNWQEVFSVKKEDELQLGPGLYNGKIYTLDANDAYASDGGAFYKVNLPIPENASRLAEVTDLENGSMLMWARLGFGTNSEGNDIHHAAVLKWNGTSVETFDLVKMGVTNMTYFWNASRQPHSSGRVFGASRGATDGGPGIIAYDMNTNSFSTIPSISGGDVVAHYKDIVWIGDKEGRVWASADGSQFNIHSTFSDPQVRSIGVYNDTLYIAVGADDRSRVTVYRLE